MLVERLGKGSLEAVLELLGTIRRAATAEVPRASVSDFPGLTESWRRARGLLESRRRQLRREQEELERQLEGPVPRALDDVNLAPPSAPPSPPQTMELPAPRPASVSEQTTGPSPQQPAASPQPPPRGNRLSEKRRSRRGDVGAAHAPPPRMETEADALPESLEDRVEAEPLRKTLYCHAPAMQQEWGGHGMEFDRPGVHHEIERKYPFPIAYCFRATRSLTWRSASARKPVFERKSLSIPF